ncbi:MAG: hypothetical protein DMF75_18360 [Acidobacteria bacterium]|nr:MAG: hypothetical protein DMF75_18360 [Acidobacteriota bacterium]
MPVIRGSSESLANRRGGRGQPKRQPRLLSVSKEHGLQLKQADLKSEICCLVAWRPTHLRFRDKI